MRLVPPAGGCVWVHPSAEGHRAGPCLLPGRRPRLSLHPQGHQALPRWLPRWGPRLRPHLAPRPSQSPLLPDPHALNAQKYSLLPGSRLGQSPPAGNITSCPSLHPGRRFRITVISDPVSGFLFPAAWRRGPGPLSGRCTLPPSPRVSTRLPMFPQPVVCVYGKEPGRGPDRAVVLGLDRSSGVTRGPRFPQRGRFTCLERPPVPEWKDPTGPGPL